MSIRLQLLAPHFVFDTRAESIVWGMQPALRSERLGVSAEYLTTEGSGGFFAEAEEAAKGKHEFNFEHIASVLCRGDRAKGFKMTCPRDGKENCSFVGASAHP